MSSLFGSNRDLTSALSHQSSRRAIPFSAERLKERPRRLRKKSPSLFFSSNRDETEQSTQSRQKQDSLNLNIEDNPKLDQRKKAPLGRPTAFESFVKRQIDLKENQVIRHTCSVGEASNEVRLQRYSGFCGVIKLLLESLFKLAHVPIIIAIGLTQASEPEALVPPWLPIASLSLNVLLWLVKNFIEDSSLSEIEQLVNTQPVEALTPTDRKWSFQAKSRGSIEVGDVIKVYEGEEFPADCLALDVQHRSTDFLVTRSLIEQDQQAFVSKTCLESTKGMFQKRSSFYKTGLTASMKLEYPRFGLIEGEFTSMNHPAGESFTEANVILRGQKLVRGPAITCLVLNVGEQCVYWSLTDPSAANAIDMRNRQQASNFILPFDSSMSKAKAVLSLLVLFLSATLAYISHYSTTGTVFEFELLINPEVAHTLFGSTISIFLPLVLSLGANAVHLVALLSVVQAYFVENDVHLSHANVQFSNPLCSVTFH